MLHESLEADLEMSALATRRSGCLGIDWIPAEDRTPKGHAKRYFILDGPMLSFVSFIYVGHFPNPLDTDMILVCI